MQPGGHLVMHNWNDEICQNKLFAKQNYRLSLVVVRINGEKILDFDKPHQGLALG